ncbi:metal ABC transporter ATP-binding protein [Pseudaestuariivita atlantica]|uniref:Zinc ABC transporter ATPase n=1 Tax=Pseudaestuariivita atlantica TaxID=1317121 RepID=A0A0L1JR59_9RHOB|nr:metal ABC transporter ATP-binding protein [Pseudaestuariivita atlantica]KNG94225.1 zinc ABC transporter ATPase [Pseudaestuariivita atlantica]
MSLIAARNLSVTLNGHRVLHDVSMEVGRGEIVTVVGPNGSGKSTLLRALIGAVETSGGVVMRDAALRIGYVPQKLHIDPSLPLTAARFVALSPVRRGLSVGEALDMAGAAGLERRQMADLSGGQFQRILMARALRSDPDILILDEPTQGLDQPGSAAFYELLDDLRRRLNIGVLMVSHELHVVMAASDRVICLNGHVCCAGAPAHVATAPEYRALFGSGTRGALALYRHDHDHDHDHHHHDHDHEPSDEAAG